MLLKLFALLMIPAVAVPAHDIVRSQIVYGPYFGEYTVTYVISAVAAIVLFAGLATGLITFKKGTGEREMTS